MFKPSQSYHIIEEYQVLWTAQKHQKSKRWQDGKIRLHTFNNRLFLTDESGSAVADKYHLSSSKPRYDSNNPKGSLCDGEDIEFEQHLVTVQDFLGWRKGEVNLCAIEEARKRKRDEINQRAEMESPQQRMQEQTPARNVSMSARSTPLLSNRGARAAFTPVRPQAAKVAARVYPQPRQSVAAAESAPEFPTPRRELQRAVPQYIMASMAKKRSPQEAFQERQTPVRQPPRPNPPTQHNSSSPPPPSTFEELGQNIPQRPLHNSRSDKATSTTAPVQQMQRHQSRPKTQNRPIASSKPDPKPLHINQPKPLTKPPPPPAPPKPMPKPQEPEEENYFTPSPEPVPPQRLRQEKTEENYFSPSPEPPSPPRRAPTPPPPKLPNKMPSNPPVDSKKKAAPPSRFAKPVDIKRRRLEEAAKESQAAAKASEVVSIKPAARPRSPPRKKSPEPMTRLRTPPPPEKTQESSLAATVQIPSSPEFEEVIPNSQQEIQIPKSPEVFDLDPTQESVDTQKQLGPPPPRWGKEKPPAVPVPAEKPVYEIKLPPAVLGAYKPKMFSLQSLQKRFRSGPSPEQATQSNTSFEERRPVESPTQQKRTKSAPQKQPSFRREESNSRKKAQAKPAAKKRTDKIEDFGIDSWDDDEIDF